MKKTQKQKVLETLQQKKGKWVSFRAFRWLGIAEPGSRKSELVSEGYEITNQWFINEKGQKCSYYSMSPRIKSAKDAFLKGKTVEFLYS